MRIIVFAAIALSVTAAASAQTNSISGLAHVSDGDSLVINDTRIRLFGIDAPELEQQCTRNGASWACGQRSKRALQDMVGNGTITCTPQSIDKHGRTVAICSDQYGELNAAMVETGWATAYRFYSDRYVAAEESAKSARIGIWDSQFVEPREYRVTYGIADPDYTPPAPTKPKPEREYASSKCDIKGNRARDGEWIYHLPGMKYYDQTRAEQFFCSEEAARKAGYRRSRSG